MSVEYIHHADGTMARVAGFFVDLPSGHFLLGDGVQGLTDRPQVGQDVWLEVRAHWPHRVPREAELARLGVALEDARRLIVVAGGPDGAADVFGALIDPLTEEFVGETDGFPFLDVLLKSGVTDSEGEAASVALLLAMGEDGQGAHIDCRSGVRYRFCAAVPREARSAVERLAGNPLIHFFHWSDDPDFDFGVVRPENNAGSVDVVEAIDLEGKSDDSLLRISREFGLALNLAEMRVIAAHFDELGRAPTDVEMQTLAQTWSEHCSHKTFKAEIELELDGGREVVARLLPSCIVEPSLSLDKPWMRSAFSDNAGVIAFDDDYDVACKVETHNHPSALEPFGGAHTGIGGVIRDILAVSADPIANTDVLCFGPLDLPEAALPTGIFHPTASFQEVVRGIADYGNNMGIPTVGGAVLFHPGYVSNPLVYCGTLGLVPRGSHPTEPQSGDVVMLVGGHTGRDGLHGATMSSACLDRPNVEGTVVQIGNPITEKTVRDVLPRLRDERLYHAITDCGAGGLCSAVGEMGQKIGVEVDLDAVPLKYPGLRAWEIWLSEAQERMVLAVPPESVGRVRDLCVAYDAEASVVGRFIGNGRLHIRHWGETVADLSMEFLHDGRPARRLTALWTTPQATPSISVRTDNAEASLLALLRDPWIASKEEVIRRYDHEVGAGTIVKPLVGNDGPSDAAVLKPRPESRRGVVIAHGINPLYGDDPHAMALLAIDEALRNLVSVGGSIDHAALLDNFCWGDVDDPRQLGGLVRAAQGCRDAILAYETPFICGKDSLYNSNAEDGSSIPGTLLISAIGVMPDVGRAITMDLKRAGNLIYVLGLSLDEMGGSFYLWQRGLGAGVIPLVRPHETTRIMRHLTRAIERGLVQSCHDLSEGGLAVAAAEMVIAGELGLHIQLGRMPVEGTVPMEALLFGESPGRFLVEVNRADAMRFEQLFDGLPIAAVGAIADGARLRVTDGRSAVVDLDVATLSSAWRRR